ncbi:dihydrofolate reductase [Paludibacter sp. 221]|uniref:dihydrofolate reductase n=1 Tax=Paludibacter sp. 221 TaxID=2302939 RepID=UPI0013D129F3|nr:dihydrofolate reductase [Paludibacter sp. 221]NDV45909.1 dihydrofolate reductase [Paludibacter sp. 221]
MPKISIIVAVADNYAIGKDNKLLWHLPADLKHFKNLTTGHTIVMGRRTFESLPNGPLPNRKNIVLSTVVSEGVAEGYFEADSLEDAFELAENESEIFVIGGSSIYKQCMDTADYMYVTWVRADFQADAYFPEIDFDVWKEVSREDHKADEKNPYDYSFVEYRRI